MSELPVSWVSCTLADVGDIVGGGTPSTKNPEFWGEEIPWISPADLTGYKGKYIARGAKSLSKRGLAESSAKLMPARSVHFSSRAPIGYVAISSNRLCTNQGFKSLVPGEGVLSEYVYFYLKSIKGLANSLATGTTFKELSGAAFAKLPIPLPPLPEQKRIVAKIEELFSELEAGEASLRKARRQLGVYRQSLLKQAFEGKLTAKWRTQNPAKLESPSQLLAHIQSARQNRFEETLKKWDLRSRSDDLPKQAKPRAPLPVAPLESEVLSGLPRLPDGWTWAKMENTCEIVRGGSPRPAGDPQYYDGDIPFLKVADLTRVDGPYVDNFTSTIKPAGLHKTRYVEPPVLLISNSGATLGVPRICRIAATFNDGVAAFLDLDSGSHRYFYYFWTSKTEALRNIDQGAAQPNLNTDLLKSYPVPVCSLPEQQEIVRLLDEQFEAIERNERELDAALQRSEALRQAILKKAFSGRLVPQDPADEPASTLLARLRTERETTFVSKVKKDRKSAVLKM